MEALIEARRPIALIPISQHFSIRYFVLSGLLDKIGKSLDCVLVLSWKDPALEEELQSRGYRCVYMPQFEADNFYREVRRWKNAVQERDMGTPTLRIDMRRMRALSGSFRESFYFWRNDVRRILAKGFGAFGPARRFIERLEENAFFARTNWKIFAEQIKSINPDLLISATPFILSESLYSRVAKHLGVRTVGSILSFDNLTARGKIEVTFDHYIVWNYHMRREAQRIYGVDGDQVSVAGAVQMDFYSWPDILFDRVEFLTSLGLDPSRPVVLFGAGPHHIAPLEPNVLLQLDEMVSQYPESARPQILLRLHPVDGVERWQSVLDRCRNVTVARPWQVKEHFEGRIGLDDIRALASTLAWTDVHISTSSTMSLDGAIFDKPQIALAYDDRPNARLDNIMVELYQREHYLPLTQSGGIRIVRSRDALQKVLSEYLIDPTRDRGNRRMMVESVCAAPIGQAATNVAEALLSYVEREVKSSSKHIEVPVGLSVAQ